MRMEEQMATLANDCSRRGIGLYLDFPLGSNAHGFDVWRYPEIYCRKASIGAPPDLAYAQGQNWGFRPADPDALRESGYVHWIACIRQQLRDSKMLRLDHVMGLHRLYWIPDGFPADRGAYVHYRSEELYAILAIESHRCKAEIAGEDLGTVPSVVRRSMGEWGIRRLYVVQREVAHGKLLAPQEIGRDVVTSLNTHDMPPIASFREGSDLVEKGELGVIRKENLDAELEKRRNGIARLVAHLRMHGFLAHDEPSLDELVDALFEFLAESEAGVVLVNIEDLWLETFAQNIPTTTDERPNWRHRLRVAMEELELQPAVRERVGTTAAGRGV
jgi:4-alpha-glucanotransferase